MGLCGRHKKALISIGRRLVGDAKSYVTKLKQLSVDIYEMEFAYGKVKFDWGA